MKKILLLSIILIAVLSGSAQQFKTKKDLSQDKRAEISIPMEPAYWEFDSSHVQFIKHRGVSAMKGKNEPYKIFLKNHVFTNGTIEFDVELIGMGFPGINFRVSNDKKNGEHFYIRSFGPVTPEVRTTLQYAAMIDGVSIWDLSDEYQSGATIYQEGWNHVKLVVSGKQMKAYVNDMKKPALIIPELEGSSESGNISLSGKVIYANLVIKPNATEGLDPQPGYISAYHDTRYLRNWMVTEPKDFPFGKDILMPLPSMNGLIEASELPDSTARWTEIKAEPRGIVNISRKFGSVSNDARRLTWIKTTIESNKAQEKILNLGFSDEVWVFVNGQITYIDKNYFGTPSQKLPNGRCTIENTSFKIALKEGKNEILMGVANYFFGWGIIARLEDVNGIQLAKIVSP
jgi:hypothetical protein